MSQTTFVLLTILVVASIIIIFTIIEKVARRKRMMSCLKQLWGSKEPGKDRVFMAENRKSTLLAKKADHPFFIDDITWEDLNMDSVFKRLNYSRSTVGEEVLYSLLRLPILNREQLNKREKQISMFQKDENIRLSIQYILSSLGFSQDIRLGDWLYGTPGNISTSVAPYVILIVILVLSPFLFLFNPGLGLITVVAVVFTNMIVHARTVRDQQAYLEPVKYLVRMIIAAGKISKLKHEDLNDDFKRLSSLYKKMNTFSTQNFIYMQSIAQDPITEYLKTIFLGEIIFFKSTMNQLLKHQKELQEMYELLGGMDSLISIASYRESISGWCKPEFETDKGKSFSVVDAWHPLIENPVPNSMNMENAVLLTGSNASGKSTWLKVCAINVLFAQTIHTCTAKAYHSSFFRLYSSMALRDDIGSGESYYIVEIRSLKRILDAVEGEPKVFCVIDEVLRGTNTVERIAASSEVLSLLSRKGCLCMAATHDLELVQLLNDIYTPYHFQETITDAGISFDYILYQGPTETRNAIKLLALMGYEPTMVERAEEKSKKFMETGLWQ
ncbi:MAG: DNA mismatch repair protein MutS [Thermoclostridium sp.]|nr:DNA mismatch repair protein MutS [Thermoclostridium sp.]